MNGEIAVSIKNISKDFLLPHEKSTTLKSAFTGVFKGKHSKSYQRQQALRDISFEIKKGEFFGIVGRNGSGKSTLLKIIAGIYQPTKGNAKVNGKLVPFIELGVGFNPELTGRENVYLNGAVLGFSKKEIDANYPEIVDFAELEEHMDQKLKNFSSGMQVRLAFACATKSNADILLVDEVLAVGDAEFQRKCFDYFRQLKRERCTVVFVTHEMNAVREFCDSAVLIENGVVQFSGEPDSVSKNYEKIFIPSHTLSLRDSIGESQLGSKKIVYVKPECSIKDDAIIIKSRIISNTDNITSSYGLHILDSNNSEVFAINNKMMKRKDLSFKNKGEEKLVAWEFENIFATGEYSISLTLSSNDDELYHWYLNALTLDIKKKYSSTTAILPGIKCNITEINNE